MKLDMQVGLGPGQIVLDGDPALPSPKGTQLPSPVFGTRLLCPNGRPSQPLLSTCYRWNRHKCHFLACL